MIGIVLSNRYEIKEVLGEGGMATVYKALDNKLNRWVAVKVLKKEFANNEEISHKFNKEATAIANLSDMNIVNVLDVGHEEANNIDYFVMEFVDGKTLKEIIVYNGRLSYNTAITIAIQIGKALDCAHRNNIIHRDVKPQNILVTEHGDVKVTDFGIAKSSTSSTITNTTTIMGSAHYLSPEQAKGTFIDVRTDIYSLGIVLYEMVTGQLPFDGDSPVTIALKHIQENAKAPIEINPSIPKSFDSLIMKSISKDPINRYQTVKELIFDLQRIKENPDMIMPVENKEDIDGKTIVMAPIKTGDISSKPKVSKVSAETFFDDDDYEEDEDLEEDDNFKELKSTQPKPKPKKKKKTGLIVGIIIGVLCLVVFGASFILFSKTEKQISMPKIIGKKVEDVKKELEQLGLKVDIVSKIVSEEEEGTILESDPKEGVSIIQGSIVKVIVSDGVEKIKIPDLREYEVNYIKEYLDLKGIRYEIIEEYSETVEKGYFIRQEPERGTEVTKDTVLRVTVSIGPEVKLVSVRNYEGFKFEAAKNDLESNNLKVVSQIRETNKESEDGIVLENTNAGEKVPEGNTITLYVGKYVPVPVVEEKINVSNYISKGMTLSVALEKLTQQGIDYIIDGGTPEDDLASYQIKSFTQEIKKGEKVKIQIEKIIQTPPPTEGNDGSDGEGTNP